MGSNSAESERKKQTAQAETGHYALFDRDLP